MKRKAMRFGASGLEAKLGAFFEKNPAKRKLAQLKGCDDMKKMGLLKRLTLFIFSSLFVLSACADEREYVTKGENSWVVDGLKYYYRLEDSTCTLVEQESFDIVNMTIPRYVSLPSARDDFYRWFNFKTYEVKGISSAFSASAETVTVEIDVDTVLKNWFSFSIVKSVEFKGKVRCISENAFRYCNALTAFRWPTGLEVVGERAFSDSGLREITIPAGVQIGKEAFAFCSAISNVIFEVGAEDIAEGLFSNCSKLSAVTIPEGIEKIGTYAFVECDITGVLSLPNTIQEIGDYAFSGNNHLDVRKWPDALKMVGASAFFGTAVSSLDFSNTQLETVDAMAFAEIESVTGPVVFPATLKTLGDGSFQNIGENVIEVFYRPNSGREYRTVRFLGLPPAMGSNVFTADRDRSSLKNRYRIGKYPKEPEEVRTSWESSIASWMEGKIYDFSEEYAFWHQLVMNGPGVPPEIREIQYSLLWLTCDGPYKTKVYWNDFDQDRYRIDSVDLQLMNQTRQVALKRVTCEGVSVKMEADSGRLYTELDLAQFVPSLFDKGEHGRYLTLAIAAYQDRESGQKGLKTNLYTADGLVVYFPKFEKYNPPFGNWYWYWLEDRAVDTSAEPKFFCHTDIAHVLDDSKGECGFANDDGCFYYDAQDALRNKANCCQKVKLACKCSGLPRILEGGGFAGHKYVTDSAACRGASYLINNYETMTTRFVGGEGNGTTFDGIYQFVSDIVHETRHQQIEESLKSADYVIQWRNHCSDTLATSLQELDGSLDRLKELAETRMGEESNLIAKYDYWRYCNEIDALLDKDVIWDSDGDGISDKDENSGMWGVRTDPTKRNSCNLAGPRYGLGGDYSALEYADNEVLARYSENENAATIRRMVTEKLDFAFPGCQGEVGRQYMGLLPDAWESVRGIVEKAAREAYSRSEYEEIVSADNLGQKIREQEAICWVSDYDLGEGPDADGGESPISVSSAIEFRLQTAETFVSALELAVPLENVSEQSVAVRVSACLVDGNSNIVSWTTALAQVPAHGLIQQMLVFSGPEIAASNGKGIRLSNVVIETKDEEGAHGRRTIDEALLPSIGDLSDKDFLPPDIIIDAGAIVDRKVAADLVLSVPVDINVPGEYKVSARLGDSDNQQIATFVTSYQPTRKGRNTIDVRFDGNAIRRRGVGGKYRLTALVFERNKKTVAYLDRPVETRAYSASEFGSPEAVIRVKMDEWENFYGQTYFLTVENASRTEKSYWLSATLKGSNGVTVASCANLVTLSSGKNLLKVSFSDEEVERSSVSGPYYVEEVLLGSVSDNTDLCLKIPQTGDGRDEKREYGPFVPGESVWVDTELVGYKAIGLPTGLKYDNKTGIVSGTPTKSGTNAVTFTWTDKTVKPNVTHKASSTFIVGPLPVLSVQTAGEGTGKVTGAGAYAANKKVTLKATADTKDAAAKGKNPATVKSVFAGWYDATGGLVAQTPSLSYVMPPYDVALQARFIPASNDWATVDCATEAGSVRVVTNETKVAISPITVTPSGGSLPTVKVAGLPTGLKFTAKDIMKKNPKTEVDVPANTIYGTPTKGGVYNATVTVTTAGKASVVRAIKFIIRTARDYVVDADWDPVQGKVTGVGVYQSGKKVTLKATANKGYVFNGWYDGDILVSRLASCVLTMPTNDVEMVAAFVTAGEDVASIGATVNGFAFGAGSGGEGADVTKMATNVMAGVYLAWPVAASALSETTVKVAGLPSGLKFTAKPITSKVGTGNTAVTVTNVPPNTIYGAPTAASKMAKSKDGTVTVVPSAVKVTVTTAGKNKQTYQIDMTVDPLPAWAVGTFAGPSYEEGLDGEGAVVTQTNGAVSVTVAASGKISAKQPVNGKATSFAANYFDCHDVGQDAFRATLTAKVGKEIVTSEMVVSSRAGRVTLSDRSEAVVTNGVIVADLFDAWQYNWKVEPWKMIGKSFDKREVTYEEDGVKVALKFSANGTAKVAGEFATYDMDGNVVVKNGKPVTVKASGSATLLPVFGEDGDTRYLVFVYLTPKGLPPHARCMEIGL